MKKIFLSFAILSSVAATAQLPNGSIAPDFTLTDINGVSHNLYTYLDQGKTVFLHISTTWCTQCWSYHQTGAFEDLWTNHGPSGGAGVSASTTDDVVTIFIEGDGSTTDAQLHGQGSDTEGDWTAGINYPVIDIPESSTLMGDYGISSLPTIYKICPNRIIDHVGKKNAADLYAEVADCPAPASNLIDVRALAHGGVSYICGPANYTPSVKIQNNGFDTLTNATISISYNGNTISTGTFTGSLGTYELATVTCSEITNFSGGDLVTSVTTNNDADASNNGLTYPVLGAVESNNKILLTLTTDDYSAEVAWSIKDAANQDVPGTTNPTLANATTYDEMYEMPSLGCYYFVITDTYIDGLGTGTIYLRDDNGTVLFDNPAYGSGITIPFKVVEMVGTSSLVENVSGEIKVYPNPSNGMVYLNSENLAQYKAVDLLDASGRILASWNVNANAMSLDMKAIANGNYLLVFKGDLGKTTQKIQINK